MLHYDHIGRETKTMTQEFINDIHKTVFTNDEGTGCTLTSLQRSCKIPSSALSSARSRTQSPSPGGRA